MPHKYEHFIAATEEDPVWKKAIARFIKKGYSLAEIKKQHKAWKDKQAEEDIYARTKQLEKNLEKKKF